MTIRVLLADDQPLLRAGFKILIDSEPDLVVVGEAATGREAVELTTKYRPDLVLMDIRMPDMDGLTATELITADRNLGQVRVLIITTFEIDEHVFHALRAGAAGFIGKTVAAGELLSAIRAVMNGDSLLSPAATKSLINRFLATPDYGNAGAVERLDTLTSREREVLVLVAQGLSNDDIAEFLVVSPHTAKTHVNRAMTKLGARDRAQLVVTAYECGLMSGPVNPR